MGRRGGDSGRSHHHSNQKTAPQQGNSLTTWYGYSGYQGSGNNDPYDALEVTWNWGAGEDFGKLWRICTAPDANTRCQGANKDLTASGQIMDIRMGYDEVGNVSAVRDYLNDNQVQWFTYDHLNRLETAYTSDASGNSIAAYTQNSESNDYDYDKLGNIVRLGNGTTYNYTSWNANCTGHPTGHSLPHAVKLLGSNYYCYDENGNMTKRVEGSVTYNQTFNVENELVTIVSGSNTTTAAYDANGIRTKTVSPSGVTTYYPFPGYEEEVNGSTTTRRITYSAAGQAIALRVQVVNGSNTLYYLHSDHLGSTSLATNTSGVKIPGSDSRYYPFGDWRTEPTANLTDRGFTGHLHNNIGSGPDDIGLVYMAARWYLPATGRFISADSIIPNPANPQSYNRYSYVENQPLNHTDPTGHCKDGTVDQCLLDGGPGYADGSFIQTGDNVPQVLTDSELGTIGTIASFVPYLDTGDDIATALTGCGYACQAGSEEPVGWFWRGVAGVGIVAPFGSSMLRHGSNEALELLSKFGDDVVEGIGDAGKLSASNWRDAERVLSGFLDTPKNTQHYFADGMSTYRIPDFITDEYIADSKFYSATTLTDSAQLRDLVVLATSMDLPLNIYVREGTNVSSNALQMIQGTGGDVIHIFEGP